MVVAPRLAAPRLVAGPPSASPRPWGWPSPSTALILWFGFGEQTACWVLVGMLTAAALAESAFGFCIGCRVFGLLMKRGIIPDEVCAACADISRRHPQLRGEPART